MVELGRVDTTTEVSELASKLTPPCKGHLDAAFRICSHLKCKHNSSMVCNPMYPAIEEENFPKRNWNDFHGKVEETSPPAVPNPLGLEVIV